MGEHESDFMVGIKKRKNSHRHYISNLAEGWRGGPSTVP